MPTKPYHSTYVHVQLCVYFTSMLNSMGAKDVWSFCLKMFKDFLIHSANVNDLPLLIVRHQGDTYTDFKVRRDRVLSALIWLKENNKCYSV